VEIHNNSQSFKTLSPVVLTIGTFDGVHAGHLAVINVLMKKAKEIGGKTALLTFHPHPRVVLHPDNHGLKLLTSLEERARLLESAGLDHLIIESFNTDLSRLSPLEYVKTIFAEGIKPKIVVIGDDHRFGRNREGDFSKLVDLGNVFGFEVCALDAEFIDDIRVSSTKVREAISKGEMRNAATLLTKEYEINATVVKGNQLGRTIGFPTANLKVNNHLKLIPANGVYAVKVKLENSDWLPAMLNIGQRPTVSESGKPSIEVHIFNFSSDIYNEKICVKFIERVRDEKKFDDIRALQLAIEVDQKTVLGLLQN
jgi:riboflavin kinase/FMN adenylyltransferase